METVIQVGGWIGTILILLAYLLLSIGKIKVTDPVYQILNLLGVVGVGANVFHQQAWPALGLQIAWGLIALVSLFNIFKVKNRG